MHLFKSVPQCFLRAGYVPICGKRGVLLLLGAGGPADPAGGGRGGQRSKGAAREPGVGSEHCGPRLPPLLLQPAVLTDGAASYGNRMQR